MIRTFTFALALGLSAVAFADDPSGVRLGLTDQTAPAAPALRKSPAVRVAALVRSISSRSESRRTSVPVYRDETEYAAESLPHHLVMPSNRYGYQPSCCEDVGFADGLWTGYCETRHSHWMHGSWFMRRFLGQCEDGCKTTSHSANCKACK